MSYFTEPIYFSSIILGSLYHADHLSRAMYQRIADIDDLPQSFSLNRPLLSGENLRALERFSSQPSHLLHLCCWCDGSQYTFGFVRGQKSLQFWKLSPDYRVALNTLFIYLFLVNTGISNAEARQPGKAPNFSVNWAVGDQGLEVINATTGKDDLGRPSRLCKHALYSRWMRLHSKVISVIKARFDHLSYNMWKISKLF